MHLGRSSGFKVLSEAQDIFDGEDNRGAHLHGVVEVRRLLAHGAAVHNKPH